MGQVWDQITIHYDLSSQMYSNLIWKDSRFVRFGSNAGQIGPKCDKSKAFSNQIWVHYISTSQTKRIVIWSLLYSMYFYLSNWPGPTSTMGTSCDCGNSMVPRLTHTGILGQTAAWWHDDVSPAVRSCVDVSVSGWRLASHVEQTPRRGRCSLVRYVTTAISSWIWSGWA